MMKSKKQYEHDKVVRETFYADDGSVLKERFFEKPHQVGIILNAIILTKGQKKYVNFCMTGQ